MLTVLLFFIVECLLPTVYVRHTLHKYHSYLIKQNKTDNVRITQHWGAFIQPLLRSKSNKYCTICVCICSFNYTECNAHASRCHLWPARLYYIFSHYLIPSTIFGEKKLLNIKCVLISSTTFLWNISHSKKNWARYDQKCISVFK